MARIQLALNVDDLDDAIAFYSTLFATEPAKVRPGYANFAVADPPVKLVLIENAGRGGSLNHLGVEVATTDEVRSATDRLRVAELDTVTEDDVTCCYAVQDKVWVDDPDGAPWEIYTVLADAETSRVERLDGGGTCGAGRCDTATDARGAEASGGAAPGADVCCAG